MLNALDLFSGIGGNTIALREYTRTIAYCEQDRHAQSVLLSRMSDGSIDSAPICKDITKLDGNELRGFIDIIIGGFPCQDISVAGKGAGLEGERSGLFFEIVRLAKEIQPTFLFLENVPAIRTRGLDTVIQELTEAGYDCRWTMLSASEVGAPHKRERWFLLGHSNHYGLFTAEKPGSNEKDDGKKSPREVCSGQSKRTDSHRNLPRSFSTMADPDSMQLNSLGTFSGRSDTESCRDVWWQFEPDLARVANGVPHRVDRIKRLGNAVVPQQAKKAFEILLKLNPNTSQRETTNV